MFSGLSLSVALSLSLWLTVLFVAVAPVFYMISCCCCCWCTSCWHASEQPLTTQKQDFVSFSLFVLFFFFLSSLHSHIRLLFVKSKIDTILFKVYFCLIRFDLIWFLILWLKCCFCVAKGCLLVNKNCVLLKLFHSFSLSRTNPDSRHMYSHWKYTYIFCRLVNKSVCTINTHFNHKTNTKNIL